MYDKNKQNFCKVILFLSLITLFLGVIKGILKQQPVLSLYLFTRQTVLMICMFFIFEYMFFQNKNKHQSEIVKQSSSKNKIQSKKGQKPKIKKIISFLSFLCFINSIMLIILYPIGQHGFFNSTSGFYMIVVILEHYILPLIFIYYYFFIDKTTLKLKQFYIGLIYPFIYFLITMIVGTTFNTYPYHFLENINTDVIKFILIILVVTILIIFVSLISIFIKNKIINKHNIKHSKNQIF